MFHEFPGLPASARAVSADSRPKAGEIKSFGVGPAPPHANAAALIAFASKDNF